MVTLKGEFSQQEMLELLKSSSITNDNIFAICMNNGITYARTENNIVEKWLLATHKFSVVDVDAMEWTQIQLAREFSVVGNLNMMPF